jgi:HAD superfamily phosphatase (TIGR01668 family)
MEVLLLRIITPREYRESFAAITPESLKARGIRAVLVDLDNTLVPWNDRTPTAELRRWLVDLRSHGIAVCIVSNNVPHRVREFADQIEVPFVSNAQKPRRKGYREAMRMLGVTPRETAMVGDQIFTDTLGGNRSGCHTILVRPLSTHEHFMTKITRRFERLWLRVLRRRGLLPPS